MQNLEWYLANLKSTGKNTIETVEKSLTDMFIRLVRIYPCLIQMLHENGKLCCNIEKRAISRDLVINRGISFCVCVPSAHRNWTRFSFSISE